MLVKSMQIFVWNRYSLGNWRAVSRWTIPELGEQCSDPDRNYFRQTWLVGIIPNPYDRTSASYAFFQNADHSLSLLFICFVPTQHEMSKDLSKIQKLFAFNIFVGLMRAAVLTKSPADTE